MADYLGIITAQEIKSLRNAKRPRMIYPLVHIALAPETVNIVA